MFRCMTTIMLLLPRLFQRKKGSLVLNNSIQRGNVIRLIKAFKR